MKLKEMNLKDSMGILLETGLFKSVLNNHLCDDGYCIPQHLIFLNSSYYFYMDHLFPYYSSKDRMTRISIMDFGKKERPQISLDEFISRLSGKDAEKFLFYIDLFI